MPTRITRIECQAGQAGQADQAGQAGKTLRIKVEGAITLADAELLESICNELSGQGCSGLSVDLTDVTFLDGESASALCRLKGQGISLEGLDLFVQKVVELAEKTLNRGA